MNTTERTLEVFAGEHRTATGPETVGPGSGRPIFSSSGKWLHPLFELEEYLRRSGTDPGDLVLQDKIVGRAAAMLIIRLGIRRIRAGILSRPGQQVLEAHGARYEYRELVERILCRTEELLAPITDLEQAYRLLRERAGRQG